MRALRYFAPQAPWTVGDVETPRAGPDEVLVEMAFAGLNPIDVHLWRGVGGLQPPTPHVPAVEGAGWLNGEPVLVFGQGTGVIRWGAAAEWAAVSKAAVFPVPDNLPLQCAAVCGASGATAMRLFELAEVKGGDTVLVLASAGNVGAMLVSLLADAGVRAIGQIRNPAKAETVARAGGEPLIAAEPAELSAALAGLAPSVVVDPLGGGWTSAAVEVLCVGGRILSFGAIAGPITLDTLKFYRKCLTLRGYSGLEEPSAHARCAVTAMRAAAKGRMLIEPLLRTFPLSQAETAFQAVRDGDPGKVVLDVKDVGGGT